MIRIHIVALAVVAFGACGGGAKKNPVAGSAASPSSAQAADLGPPRPLAVTDARGPFKDLDAACEALRGEQPIDDYRCQAAAGIGESRGPAGSGIESVTLLVVSDLEPTRYCALALRTAAGVFIYDEDNLLCEDSEFREIASARISWFELGGSAGAEALVELVTTARVRDEAGESDGRGLIDGQETRLLACGVRGETPACAPSMVVACDLVACGHLADMQGRFALGWTAVGGALEIRAGRRKGPEGAAKLVGRHRLP